MEQKLAEAVKQSKAPAISRAAAVLRLLGRSDRPLPLQAIARDLGLVPSTCLYVLRALVDEEFAAFDPDTKRYSLAAGVLTLARQWLAHDQFNELVQPALDKIAAKFDLTALGVQIFGIDHIVAVAVSRTGGNFRLSTQVGSRFPALISATGRCIAAFGDYPKDALRQRFENLRWDDRPDFGEWLEQVARTRACGYGIDRGNYIAGVTVLAAPVWRSPGRPSHALVATGLSSAIARTGEETIAEALKGAAKNLTEQMNGAAGWSALSSACAAGLLRSP